VLTLALLGLLAVATPADTALRVPGTTLRFGLTDTVMSARGFVAAGTDARKGRCRFFGLAGAATLAFEQGRLARVDLAVSGASAFEIAYVRDQLTAMGYRQTCEGSPPGAKGCDWIGRTRVHLVVDRANLTASVAPASAAEAAVPRMTAATTTRLPRDTLGVTPREPAPALPRAPRDTGRVTPRATRDTLRTAARVTARSQDEPAPAATVVSVLPETLAVQVPHRASPYAPATLLSEPSCDYPETARAAGIQGRIWILAFVDTDGHVIRAQLKSGIPVLNAAALECVKGWHFYPVSRKGAPCRFWVLVPVTFTVP
jgi:TonB family protein